jgi:hypothetical protein
MRTGLITILALFICGIAHGQFTVDPQQPPQFYSGNGKWSPWHPSTRFPKLSFRSACGDNASPNGAPLFTVNTQVQSHYGEPVYMVWAVTTYHNDTAKNQIGGSMSETLKPGDTTEAIAAVGGHCSEATGPVTTYIRVSCVASAGQEATCYSNGNEVPSREAGAFTALPPQTAEPRKSKTGSPSNKTDVAGSEWVCQDDEILKFGDGRPDQRATDPWHLRFNANGTVQGGIISEPQDITMMEGDNWSQTGSQVSWIFNAIGGKFSGTITGDSLVASYDGFVGGGPSYNGTLNCKPKSHK